MRTCNYCSFNIPDGAQFCPNCKKPVPVQPVYNQPPVFNQPQQPIYNQPVNPATSQNAKYSEQTKSVFETADVKPAQPQPPVQPVQNYNMNQQNYQRVYNQNYNQGYQQNTAYQQMPMQNYPNNMYGAPVKKKSSAGKIIAIAAGAFIGVIVLLTVISVLFQTSVEDKVGEIDGNTYTNDYADITFKAPDENWTFQKGEEHGYEINSFIPKTDKNGRKYYEDEAGNYLFYYDAVMSNDYTGSTVEIILLNSTSDSTSIDDLKEQALSGLDKGTYEKTGTTTKMISNKEWEVHDYLGTILISPVYRKTLVRKLDKDTIMFINIISLDKQESETITENIE